MEKDQKDQKDFMQWFSERRAEARKRRMQKTECKIKLAERRALTKKYWEDVLYKSEPKLSPDELARAYWRLFAQQAERRGHEWGEATDLLYTCLIASETASPSAITALSYKGIAIDADKGVLISGPVGIGKTTAFRNAFRYPDFRGRIVSCIEIQKQAQRGGFKALEEYEKPIPIVFDDLGLESPTNHFGTIIDPVHDIMMKRYENYKRSGVKTHFTTNLTAQEVIEKYGTRFFDRLCDMCSFVKVGGTSYRRQKKGGHNG